MKRSSNALAERFIWRFSNRGGEGQYTRGFSGFDAEFQAQHQDSVLGVAFSPDGNLASGGHDRTLQLWRIAE